MKLVLQNLHDEIRARKLRRALAIYVGATIPTVGIANLLESRYSIPHVWFDRLLILLAFGLIFTAIVAWLHGKEEIKQFHRSEFLIYPLLFAAAAVVVVFVPREEGPLRPARTAIDKSIAVLPFENFSDSKEDEYFSDGVTEDILTQLSKISELRVISRTTMMQYKGTRKTIQEIGRELMVGSVLEGSIRRDHSRVRIVGQLIDARTDEHLWADTFEHELKDVFAIQTQVAQQIARALKAVLSPKEERRISTPPTSNFEAYAVYLQGRQHYSRYTPDENEKAVQSFKRAAELDSSFALAYAGLSDAYSQRVQRHGYTINWLDSAVAAAKRALALDDESAEGYKALGLAYDNLGRTDAALEEYERAVEINPNYTVALRNIGLLNYRTGKLDRGLAAAVKVVSLAPDEVIGYVQVGMALQALEHDSAAAAWYHRGRRLDGDNPFPLLGLGWLFVAGGDLDQAEAVTDTLMKLAPSLPPALDLLMTLKMQSGDYPGALTTSQHSGTEPAAKAAFCLLKLGKEQEGRQMAEETIDRARRFVEGGDQSSTPLWEGASAFAVIGNKDSATAWMVKAFEAGWRDYRLAMKDPVFSAMRNDQTFQRIIGEARGRVEAMRDRVSGISF
jgi:TolB-like protein